MTKDRLPNPRRRRARRGRRGFNLLELLVVITIIGMIAGIVGINLKEQMDFARIKTAETELHNLAKALALYQMRFRRYPSTQEGLQALVSPPNGSGPLIDKVPEDPWGKTYIYATTESEKGRRFLLASAGPDGTMDTPDDIRN